MSVQSWRLGNTNASIIIMRIQVFINYCVVCSHMSLIIPCHPHVFLLADKNVALSPPYPKLPRHVSHHPIWTHHHDVALSWHITLSWHVIISTTSACRVMTPHRHATLAWLPSQRGWHRHFQHKSSRGAVVEIRTSKKNAKAIGGTTLHTSAKSNKNHILNCKLWNCGPSTQSNFDP